MECMHGVAPGRSARSSALVSSPRFDRAPVLACQRHEQQAQVQKTIMKVFTFFCRAFRHGWERSRGITFPPQIEIACMCCTCMAPMHGCRTAPVLTTSRLQVLHHWRVPQRKEGSWCNVRTQMNCSSAREGRSVRSHGSGNVVDGGALLDALDAGHDLEQVRVRGVVDPDGHDGVGAAARAAHGHEGDVDVLLRELAGHGGDDAGLIALADQQDLALAVWKEEVGGLQRWGQGSRRIRARVRDAFRVRSPACVPKGMQCARARRLNSQDTPHTILLPIPLAPKKYARTSASRSRSNPPIWVRKGLPPLTAPDTEIWPVLLSAEEKRLPAETMETVMPVSAAVPSDGTEVSTMRSPRFFASRSAFTMLTCVDRRSVFVCVESGWALVNAGTSAARMRQATARALANHPYLGGRDLLQDAADDVGAQQPRVQDVAAGPGVQRRREGLSTGQQDNRAAARNAWAAALTAPGDYALQTQNNPLSARVVRDVDLGETLHVVHQLHGDVAKGLRQRGG